ncbi:hypothetical protein N0V90_013412 [Kalmusia sp. IMI 367209]|nr:hypothetical protein N0V90_013412 [Kalmusia sp. IMI 367209]
MDAAVTTEPKKRGRPRKVVEEGAVATGEAKKSVRKASTKTAAVKSTKKEEAPKKVTKTSKAAKAPKAPKAAEKPTPVTPSTSKILDEVYKTGTVKPPPPETVLGAVEAATAQAIPASETAPPETFQAQPEVQPSRIIPPQSPSSAPQPSTTTTIPPPSLSKPTASSPPLSEPTPLTPTSSPPPKPTTPLTKPTSTAPFAPKPRTSTIPLPTHTITPSIPAAPRPKPPTAEALLRQQTERDIREGRMPRQYKGGGAESDGHHGGDPCYYCRGVRAVQAACCNDTDKV